MKSRKSRRKNAARLCILVAAMFIIIFDSMVVVVAMPSISQALNFSGTELSWVANSYFVTLGAFLILGGRAVDSFGKKRMFLLGAAVFSAASLFASFSENKEFLIASRALQGLAAAVVLPATLAILTTSFADGQDRQRAIGIWAGANATTGAFALIIGGLLTDLASWSAIFLVNAILGFAVVAISIVLLEKEKVRENQRINFRSAIILTLGMAALVHSVVSAAEHGWLSEFRFITFIVAIMAILAFIRMESTAPEPFLSRNLIRSRNIMGASILISTAEGVRIVTTYLASIYLQDMLQLSALTTGMVFGPSVGAVVLSSFLAHIVIKHFGFRWTIFGSMLFITIGTALLAQINANGGSIWGVLPGIMVTHSGVGAAVVTAIILATTKLADREAGAATAIVNSAQRIGAALWLAVFSSIAAENPWQLESGSESSLYLPGFGLSMLILAVATAIMTVVLTILLRANRVQI